jgi:hypothetical protein
MWTWIPVQYPGRPTVCLPSGFRICWILWISFRKGKCSAESLKLQKSTSSRRTNDAECTVTGPSHAQAASYNKSASGRRYRNVGNVRGKPPTPLCRVEALAHSLSTVIHWPGSSSLQFIISVLLLIWVTFPHGTRWDRNLIFATKGQRLTTRCLAMLIINFEYVHLNVSCYTPVNISARKYSA